MLGNLFYAPVICNHTPPPLPSPTPTQTWGKVGDRRANASDLICQGQSKTNRLREKIKLPWFYQLLSPQGYSKDSLDEVKSPRSSPGLGGMITNDWCIKKIVCFLHKKFQDVKTIWTQIRPDIMSGRIWEQTTFKVYISKLHGIFTYRRNLHKNKMQKTITPKY